LFITAAHVQELGDLLHDCVHARLGRVHFFAEFVKQNGLIIKFIMHGLAYILEGAHTTRDQLEVLFLLIEELLSK
jgi:hypothetical protein